MVLLRAEIAEMLMTLHCWNKENDFEVGEIYLSAVKSLTTGGFIAMSYVQDARTSDGNDTELKASHIALRIGTREGTHGKGIGSRCSTLPLRNHQ